MKFIYPANGQKLDAAACKLAIRKSFILWIFRQTADFIFFMLARCSGWAWNANKWLLHLCLYFHFHLRALKPHLGLLIEWVVGGQSSIFHAFIWHFILVSYLISLQVFAGWCGPYEWRKWMPLSGRLASATCDVYNSNGLLRSNCECCFYGIIFANSGNFNWNCCNQRFNDFLRGSLFFLLKYQHWYFLFWLTQNNNRLTGQDQMLISLEK